MAENIPVPAGETPGETAPVTPTPENPGETPDPGTSPATEPEPAESDSETPPEAEPAEDPAEPLKRALESERAVSKSLKKELKDVRQELAEVQAELLKRDTLHLANYHQLTQNQRDYLNKLPTLPERQEAARVMSQRQDSKVGAYPAPKPSGPKPPGDMLPTFKKIMPKPIPKSKD